MISILATVGALMLLQAPVQPPQHPAVASGDSAYSAGAWSKALSEYEKATAAQPSNIIAHVKAGYSAINANQLSKAREHFRAAVAAAPNGAPNAKSGLAIVAAREGNTSAAVDMLDSAVLAGYGNWEVMDKEKAFDAVRSSSRFAAIRKRAAAASQPCMSDSASRAFDFWIGEWDVYVNRTGQKAGDSRVEMISGGCAILENWTATSGYLTGPPSDGKSMNFVDLKNGLWKQVWMGSGRGHTEYVDGKYADGAMRFTFARPNLQGQQVTGRFAFFNLGPNKVRQFQESSLDGGKTFTTNYDFIYVRKGSGERPE